MSATDTPKKNVVPMLQGQLTATITPPWFVDRSEYTPKLASFQPLVNGEEAFGAVYRAVEAAKKSVCIICWGFQPSMYFVRDGKSLMFGELLETKARKGVMVRVLCWAYQPTSNVVVNVTGFSVNVFGSSLGLDESNTPGRWTLGIEDEPNTSSAAQYEYDKKFYRIYDRKQSVAGEFNRKHVITDDYPKNNLLFTSRTYSSDDRMALDNLELLDQGLAKETKSTLAGFPSHHQKMVLVDYEDKDAAVAFVMGHNMLDAYWDTAAHSWQVKAANKGRNGSTPRHDYSSRVTGGIAGDLFLNFSYAWQMETGESLPKANFGVYKPRGSDAQAYCQILRTQPQFGKTADIMTCYLQAASNASQYIHIENQYFRWPPLAEKIKASAAKMAQWGRKPDAHGSLYLFVITNSSDAGMGFGTVNTYRMLDSLGRADRLPEVARDQRLADVNTQLKAVNHELAPLMGKRNALDQQARLLSGPGSTAPGLNERYAPLNQKIAPLETRKRALEEAKARLEPKSLKERIFGSDRTPEGIKQANIPGLKVHIATLVAPDTPAGTAWQEVYIHAKLMLVDDAFMTLGSANINTRSMQTDSELNIAHHRPEITTPFRNQQWERYGGGKLAAGMELAEAYKKWDDLMNDNADRKEKLQRPVAQLAEFLRTSDKISNKD